MKIAEGFTNHLHRELLETNEIENNIFAALKILRKSM